MRFQDDAARADSSSDVIADGPAGDATARDAVAGDAIVNDAAATDAPESEGGAGDAASADSVVAPPEGDADAESADGSLDASRDSGEPDGGPWIPPFADTDFCAESFAFGAQFTDTIDVWIEQDNLVAPPSGRLLFVGSSSARRYESFAQDYAPYQPLQRGFGGAQLGEVALRAQDLVLRHQPGAVLVFAGTNDAAAGVAPDGIVTRFRCLRQQVGRSLGWETPVVFIGITPTPSRWAGWGNANAVNEGVRALAEADRGVFYADVTTPFLATGSPPRDDLFVDDRLHLSEEGYALWNAAIAPVVAEAFPAPVPLAPASPPPPGSRIRVDFGPNDGVDGEDTATPDYLGNVWNNWHALAGGGSVLAGEHLSDLVTTEGVATGVELVITGGFSANGWRNGGLRWPEQERLGELAVGSASGDYFFASGPDEPGAFVIRGLDPNARYALRLFGSREADDERRTRYIVSGRERGEMVLQTSGAGAGVGTANDREVAGFAGVAPDLYGQIFVDLRIDAGPFAYVSFVEIETLE